MVLVEMSVLWRPLSVCLCCARKNGTAATAIQGTDENAAEATASPARNGDRRPPMRVSVSATFEPRTVSASSPWEKASVRSPASCGCVTLL